MKKIKILLALVILWLAIGTPADAQSCTTMSGPCPYFYVDEDYCRTTWNCVSCSGGQSARCCHIKTGACLPPYWGQGYFEYCDDTCGGSTKG